jgi:cytochrome c oxidase subunit 4
MDHSTQGNQSAHPTPFTYFKVGLALVVITATEVAIFYVEALRGVIIPIFIAMSAVKFALVAMFYMHLKFDHRLFSALFFGGLLLATCLIVVLMALL